MYDIKTVSPLDLHLDEKNPRFKISVNPTQEDIRSYMLDNENILRLASRMVNMNRLLPGERIIIFIENDVNIVLEGNRRTCIYQMFLDRTLIPTQYTTRFPYAGEQLLNEIRNISVDVVSSREEAMVYLAARHLEGVKDWSSISKWRISYELFNEGKTINDIANYLILKANDIKTYIGNYKILLRGLNTPNWSEDEKRSLNILDIKPDKLVRIFHLSNTTATLGLYYDAEYNLKSTFIPISNIDKIIEVLTRKAFIDNTLNTRSTLDNVIEDIRQFIPIRQTTNTNTTNQDNGAPDGNHENNNGNTNTDNNNNEGAGHTNTNTQNNQGRGDTVGTGGNANLPYFFSGLRYGHILNTDVDAHGVLRICNEVRLFSERRIVSTYPLSAAFLTRALIEHSLIYYAKKHNIQGSADKIWSRLQENGSVPKLSTIIDKYIRNLPNFITDPQIRDYFTALFSNYKDTADPLNWVVHRPQDFVLTTLTSLPGQGLLSIINYLLDI